MIPKNETEFVVLKLTFVPPEVDIPEPIISNYRTSDFLPVRAQSVCDWFYIIRSKEREELPKDNKVHFRVWKVKSNDSEMFTINNTRFDKILLFVGGTNIHWIYHNTEPVFRSAEGVTPLTLSYCNCCFNIQYQNFIRHIQENLETTGYLLSI